jgi:DNA/RNA-binding domain of Phe-tRNA-synthetase-like protein/predicted nucleic acid-binding protein
LNHFYVDASALAKMVLSEVDSEALDRFVVDSELTSCELVLAEVPRAIRRASASDRELSEPRLLERASEVLDAVALLPIDRPLLLAAGALSEPALRALDAIHVAAAIAVSPVDAFVTYDERQAAAARLAGLRTVAPSSAGAPRFQYDQAIVERFPSIVGGVIHAVGLSNGPSPVGLIEAYEAEQAAVRTRIGETPLSELPSLAAWRRVFRGFGVDPTTYRSAAEALLRRLTKQGSIPSINALVDIGNLVSIRYGLPVAVFSLVAIGGGLIVRTASGDEPFTDLGSGERETPEPGEVVFVDESGRAHARRWCWRQSAESASGPGTTEVLLTVEGHHEGVRQDVDQAIADLETLLEEHLRPTRLASAILDATARSFTRP